MDSGQSMKQIGIVGLGLVGTALSRILMEKGQRVIGFDISEQAMEAAEAIGVVPAPSLHHVAETCSLLFLCLPNSDVVKDVMYGAARPVQAGRGQLTHDSTKQHRPSGLAAWCTPGHIICDMTTGHPCDMIQLAHELRARSVGYLEVMVGGSS